MKYVFFSLAMVAVLASCSTAKVVKSDAKDAVKAEMVRVEESRLCATPWRLVKLETNGKTLVVPTDVEATIIFNQKDSRVHGRCCNSYFGMYSLKDNVLTFSKMGSTKMLCQGILNEIEMSYHQILSVPQTVSMDGKTLIFKSEKGIITFSAFNLE